ncbi:MAG: response regulator, partial [Anaeromyxobacteraceae bacterium]
MSTKILLIESDAPFAEEVTSALEERGLEVRTTGDGREGYELAKEWGPDAIVLCVELPGMSGYVICQKLKKDEALKSIPLVITSADATHETFEKHKTLKVRAEDYLLKPYTPTTLLASLGSLIELPDYTDEEPAPGQDETEEEEEELVALEEEAGIEPLGGEPLGGSDLPALDLGSLPDDEPGGTAMPGMDDELKLLDEAFEGLSEPGSEAGARRLAKSTPRSAPLALDLDDEFPVAAEDVDAAAASLPEEDDAAARAALGGLDMVADDALGALDDGEPEEGTGPSEADLERDLLGGLGPDLGLGDEPDEEPEPLPSRPAVRAPSAAALRAAGIKVVAERPSASTGDAGGARLDRELSRKDATIRDLEDRLRELEDRLAETERRAEESESRAGEASSRLAAAESQASGAKSRLDSTLAQAKRLEGDVK